MTLGKVSDGFIEDVMQNIPHNRLCSAFADCTITNMCRESKNFHQLCGLLCRQPTREHTIVMRFFTFIYPAVVLATSLIFFLSQCSAHPSHPSESEEPTLLHLRRKEDERWTSCFNSSSTVAKHCLSKLPTTTILII